MMSLKEFLEKTQKAEERSLQEARVNRNQELAGIKESNFDKRYAIQVLVVPDSKILLLEHEQYKKFKKTNNLYTHHPEDTNIPVKGHYHVVGGKSKAEIYAVNMDGTAHHRKNRGITVPKREAEELRALGVNIPPSNILESRDFQLNESTSGVPFSFFIIIE